MAELWFSVLTRQLLCRGEFTSRADLAGKITSFTIRCNRTARPYTWTYDARADHRPPPRPAQRIRGTQNRHRQHTSPSRMTTATPNGSTGRR
jgi:hypothetical protein